MEQTAGDGAEVSAPIVVSTGGVPGQRWIIEYPDKPTVRIVDVFRANGTVYYLSVEGEHIGPKDPLVRQFIDSFQIATPAKVGK